MKEGKKRVLAELWGWVWRLALAVVIAQAVHLVIFQPVAVKGESMTDTLQNGEIMYVSKPEYLLGDPERFDVVLCHYPGREENFVKRVIGLPGAVVEIRSNQVYVNGEPLSEPYLTLSLIHILQIPTTLLAMIDSSVGGKTGVDLGGLKNQVGAFHQPRLVLIDPEALATLPAATLSDGAAEAVKYGVLGDGELFERLSRGGWTADAEWVIERCVTQKAALVAADERDRGSRQLLNLGHTLGHAIEKCSGFHFSHGRAVAVGMIYAARIARGMGLCGPEVEEAISAALAAGGLPLSAPYGAAELAAAAMADKKRAGAEITLVLPREIGRCELRRVPAAELEKLTRVAVGN